MRVKRIEGDFCALWKTLDVRYTDQGLEVGPYPVMYAWERPLMAEFARVVTEDQGDVLEVGFGMGLAAGHIQAFGCRTHTILEPHPEIYRNALTWRQGYGGDIRIINDTWQNQIGTLGPYDAILYDSYSPDHELEKDLFRFFELAANRLLRPGGRLAFWCKGAVTAKCQWKLLNEFHYVSIFSVRGLRPTRECKRLGFRSTMFVPVAFRSPKPNQA